LHRVRAQHDDLRARAFELVRDRGQPFASAALMRPLRPIMRNSPFFWLIFLVCPTAPQLLFTRPS
jgi:hypothetical protein